MLKEGYECHFSPLKEYECIATVACTLFGDLRPLYVIEYLSDGYIRAIRDDGLICEYMPNEWLHPTIAGKVLFGCREFDDSDESNG
jgi:hypothetical protein